jgi:SAM-dependent methyltransferase
VAIFTFHNDCCYDTVLNWQIFNLIYEKKPESVLEIAAGPGYVIGRLEKQLEIRAVGLELSDHYRLFRVTDSVIKFDLLREKFPFKDNEFDLCHSSHILCGLNDEYKPHIISEIQRVCKRGLHIVKNQDIKNIDSLDKTIHEIIVNDKIMINKVFPAPFLESANKVHLVCGRNFYNFSWTNIDVEDNEYIAKINGAKYKNIKTISDIDLAKLFASNTLIGVFSMKLLNQLADSDIMYFLEWSWQKLIPGAAIRLGFLNMNKLNRYLLHNIMPKTIHDSLVGSKNFCDFDHVKKMLEDANFTRIEKLEFNQSNYNCFKKEQFDLFPDFFDYVEARKLTV